MPAAAALLERILNEGYASGMLRAANPVTAELDPRMLVKTVAPRRFAMPRPVKPKGHYSKILEWEEEEERVASPNHRGYEQSKYEVSTGIRVVRMLRPHSMKYLRHGGAYVERVLAQSRAIALLLKIAGGGCSSDEAPQWPPAPSSVPASKQAVPSASPDLEQEQEQESGEISRWTPSPSGEVPAGFFIGRDGLEWPLPPRECMGSPIEDFLRVVRPGLQWSKTSRLTDASPSIEGTANAHPDREPSPGYFIGRDGIKWPIPPRECMSSAAWNLVNVSRPPPHHTTAPDPAPVSRRAVTMTRARGKPGRATSLGAVDWSGRSRPRNASTPRSSRYIATIPG
ncbi:hypothetical protein C8T65DRAFT_52563 [Cerioporus squamosus]|nr:hypothetical protein C8T65DRAFT_52563 [Cerioporus squamosus]